MKNVVFKHIVVDVAKNIVKFELSTKLSASWDKKTHAHSSLNLGGLYI